MLPLKASLFAGLLIVGLFASTACTGTVTADGAGADSGSGGETSSGAHTSAGTGASAGTHVSSSSGTTTSECAPAEICASDADCCGASGLKCVYATCCDVTPIVTFVCMCGGETVPGDCTMGIACGPDGGAASGDGGACQCVQMTTTAPCG